MKKILYAISAAMMVLGFSACDSDDTDNVLVMPAADALTLETPADASAEWILEKGATFTLHANKPNYGNVGPMQYAVQVAIEPEFQNCVSLNPANNSTNEMVLSETDLNNALNALHNYTYENWEDLGFVPVYMRAYTTLSGNMSTALYSNPIEYSNVAFYQPSPDTTGDPTGVYLRGGMNGWGADPAWEFLTTSDANIFMVANVTISAGTEFKVADADWGPINLGTPKEGPDFEIGTEYTLADNGDNITMPVEFTGNVQLINRRGTYSVLFTVTDSSVGSGIFLRGGMNGWNADPAWEFRAESSFSYTFEIDGITIAAGTEFKVAAAEWSDLDLGGVEGNSTIEVGVAYTLEPGGANLVMPVDFSGTAILVNNDGTYTLTFEEHLPGEPSGIYILGDMNGWGADPAWEFKTTASRVEWVLDNVTIDAGVGFKVATPDWSTVNEGLGDDPFELGVEYVMSSPGGNIPMPETATVRITLRKNGDNYTLLVEKI